MEWSSLRALSLLDFSTGLSASRFLFCRVVYVDKGNLMESLEQSYVTTLRGGMKRSLASSVPLYSFLSLNQTVSCC